MAPRPLRPCRRAGCGNLTREPDGFCAEHRALAAPAKARKGTEAWHWMYNTRLWRDVLRPGQLLREPFCRACAAQGVRTRASVVDHVTPHRGRWALFCDPGNLQSLCKSCHDRKTAMELNAGCRQFGGAGEP